MIFDISPAILGNSSTLGFSAATALAQLGQAAGRPNFELQFNIAQNKALERLDDEIQAFQDADVSGRTALLRVKAARLERNLEDAKGFKEVVSSNRLTVKDTLDQLVELRNLADPGTVAEFEAKRSQVLDSLDKLRAATSSVIAAPDGLARAKADGIAAIEAIVTNDFASAADVQAAQDAVDQLSGDLSERLTLLEINQDIATGVLDSAERRLDEARLKIDDIEIAERAQRIDEIRELQERTARIFSGVSLNFEGLQFVSSFVAQNAVLPRQVDPGSILNIFS